MIIIAGLGNPGKEYENTRHNVGALLIERLAKTWGVKSFKEQKKLEAYTALISISGTKVILVRPNVFMNENGRPIAKTKSFYKVKNENIWVIHDELDIPLGKFKISVGRSAAGHNGVVSVISCLKGNNFYRWRIGIGSELKKKGREFVLSNFSKEEQKALPRLFKDIAASIETAISSTPEKAMNEFNK